jgi:hypothetical protein
MDPIDEILDAPVRDQYGLETCWRMRLTENIWLTPRGLLIFDPALNKEDDFVAIPKVKLRIAL